MESFARKRFMNPLLAETWYIIKDSELYVYKVLPFLFLLFLILLSPIFFFLPIVLTILQRGRKIMRLFKGYASAVQQLFPDISFDAKVLRECM